MYKYTKKIYLCLCRLFLDFQGKLITMGHACALVVILRAIDPMYSVLLGTQMIIMITFYGVRIHLALHRYFLRSQRLEQPQNLIMTIDEHKHAVSLHFLWSKPFNGLCHEVLF